VQAPAALKNAATATQLPLVEAVALAEPDVPVVCTTDAHAPLGPPAWVST
jgi:hypothetical protein